MAATAGPKPVGPRLEPCLPLGLQGIDDPCLEHPVNDHRDAERARLPAVPFFGMYTRLTGRAVHGSARRWTQATNSALSSGRSTTSPSTPAVLRPAFRSVTRRTLRSVLARERSISFCRLRTRLRSPACDAVKIGCRRRRTVRSAAPQSTACQSRVPSSGPFTTPGPSAAEAVSRAVMASNLSFGSGVSSSVSAQAHLTRVSTLSGRAPSPYPASCPGGPAEGPAMMSRVCCCLSAAGVRFSGHPFPPGGSAFLAVGLPGAPPCPDPVGIPTFRTCELRPGWVPPVPRGRRCSPGRRDVAGRRLPLRSGQSLHPAGSSHRRGLD